MSLFLRIKKYQAQALNLKRLNGLPLSVKMPYLANALFGELLRIRTFGTLGLRLVEISLTDRCQCGCPHCYAEENADHLKEKELSTDQVKSLLREAKDLGATEIIFTGGEPLLRSDLLELVDFTHRSRMVVRLITNGILLSEELVMDLKKAGLNWCSISIDSPDPETHDIFRRYPGSFNNAMEGFRLLKQHRIPCSIITVARKELIHTGDLEKIVDLGKQIGATLVRINFPVPIGRFREQLEQVLDYSEREKVRELLKSGFVSMESPSEETRCTAAVTKINIRPNGDVAPCVFIPLTIGNIRESSLADIWKVMKNYIKIYATKGQCPMCDPALRQRLYEAAEKKDAPFGQPVNKSSKQPLQILP